MNTGISLFIVITLAFYHLTAFCHGQALCVLPSRVVPCFLHHQSQYAPKSLITNPQSWIPLSSPQHSDVSTIFPRWSTKFWSLLNSERKSILDSDDSGTAAKIPIEINNSSTTSSPTQTPFKPPAYPVDVNGRPIDLRDVNLLSFPVENDASIANLQTPHSGRKFRPTHPSCHVPSGKPSRFRSRLRAHWRQKRDEKKMRNGRSRKNNRRFTEGWYYRLTLPPPVNESFVFIFSIEDAGRWVREDSIQCDKSAISAESDGYVKATNRIQKLVRLLRPKYVKSPLTLACMQLLGSQDTYLVQSDEDDTKFWGWKFSQGYGCTFEWKNDSKANIVDGGHIAKEDFKMIAAMTPEEWSERVQSGFQILPFHLQGRLNGHDGTLGGVKADQGISGTAEFDLVIKPVAGWGNYPPLYSTGGAPLEQRSKGRKDYRQYSTAGWLAYFPVFEPHWQITMAHARASGFVNWNGTLYEFDDAPFYGEKNWGGAFPTKWFWTQCNSFENYPDLAFTSGGGIRELPFSFLPGKRTETLGLIGIHYNGTFYEIVPWTGEMEWKVTPWGRWELSGRCTDKNGKNQFEAEIIAVTDEPGVLLRAPTKDKGMQYACRDSGFGSVTMSLWLLEWDNELGDFVRARGQVPLVDQARSSQCTVEVGGIPWNETWNVSSKMKQPMKGMVRLPYVVRGLVEKTRRSKK
mmetsp:Transcript_7165/g.15707  ORF Transcript_7165/g.15707 Transcript_7165/m.15707 type:complete len:688 (-) Transcript_7165:1681-3744(-)